MKVVLKEFCIPLRVNLKIEQRNTVGTCYQPGSLDIVLPNHWPHIQMYCHSTDNHRYTHVLKHRHTYICSTDQCSYSYIGMLTYSHRYKDVCRHFNMHSYIKYRHPSIFPYAHRSTYVYAAIYTDSCNTLLHKDKHVNTYRISHTIMHQETHLYSFSSLLFSILASLVVFDFFLIIKSPWDKELKCCW